MVVAQALLALLLCADAPAPAPAEDERVLPAEDPPENALREIAARALAELTRADGPVGECHDDERGYSTIVRSQRSPRTASEEVIDAQTISATPRRRSADDLLRLVPGVLLSQHGAEGKGSQLFMRGFDAAHGTDVEVTLAGIPVNELSNIHGQGYLDLNFIIPEVVRRIEVQKGPYQLEQGNFANAGSIGFELGVPEPLRGTRVSYELGSTIRHRALLLHAPRVWPNKRSFMAVEAMHDRGFGQNRGARRLSSMAQVQLHKSKQLGQFDLLVAGYLADFGAPGALRADDVETGELGFYDAYRDDTRGASLRGLVGLRHVLRRGTTRVDQLAYGQYRYLQLVEDFTGYLLDPVDGDRRLQKHEFGGVGYRFRVTRPLTEGLVLVAGFNWQFDRVDQLEHQVDAEHRTVDERWDLDIAQHQLAALAGLRWLPADWALIEAGVRADMFYYWVVDVLGALGRGAGGPFKDAMILPSPRLLTRFRPAERWSIFTAYGRGLRAPEARAVVAQASSEGESVDQYRGGEPRITTSDAVELGARWEPHEVVSAGASAFGTWIGNELVFDHVSGINLERSRTRRLGGELDVRVRPAPWVELRTDLTLVHARFVESGASVPGAPPVLWTTSGYLFHRAGVRAGARLVVLGPRPLPQGARASGYALLDLSAGYRVGRLQLDLQVDNVLNRRWKEGEYNYASWFNRDDPRSAIPALHFAAGPPLTVRLGATLWL